ncbi:MAG: CDP-alcohol phosphatidyltransferase family protein [Candidatus Omnitrophica bacterium]|nr:CDP-alcohol phosphatidyltransferase family protein [Candidatus Omnitrophota bacterium]
MLNKTLRPKFEGLINQVASWFEKKGFTPNQLTLAGLALSLLAGWIFASGHLFFGGLVLIGGSLGDLLDGALARKTGKITRFGAFLDSTVDRYCDFFLFGGLILFFAELGKAGYMLLTLGALLGSFVTSYAKARAEGLNLECNVGFFERAVRVIILALGVLIVPLLPLALWALFLGTHVTALQRILHVKKLLEKNP